MSRLLSGKRALVTAAAKGIGADIARDLAAQGSAVAINFQSDHISANALVAEIEAGGGVAVAIQGDATCASSVPSIVARAEADLGGAIDIAIANVGPFQLAPLETVTPTEFDAMIRSNLNAAFYLANSVLPQMKQRGGVILTIGLSPAADHISAAPHIAPYACAKAGLASLTRSMAAEFAPFGVRVAMVAPGLIDHGSLDPRQAAWMAERVPSGRLGSAKEVANVVSFLASDLASYCSGGVFAVNGGWDWSQDRTTQYDTDALIQHLGARHHG